MSAIPNMTVFTPCDGIEVQKAVRAAAALDGPCYIRLCRNDLEDIFPENQEYKIGQPVVLREGKDVVVYTNGIMAHEALKAATMAEQEGISVSVVHIPTVKPLDEDAVKKLAEVKKGAVVCEEASIRGGLNMLISYILRGSSLPIESIAIMDVFGQSAYSHAELLKEYGLDAESILKKIQKLMN